MPRDMRLVESSPDRHSLLTLTRGLPRLFSLTSCTRDRRLSRAGRLTGRSGLRGDSGSAAAEALRFVQCAAAGAARAGEDSVESGGAGRRLRGGAGGCSWLIVTDSVCECARACARVLACVRACVLACLRVRVCARVRVVPCGPCYDRRSRDGNGDVTYSLRGKAT